MCIFITIFPFISSKATKITVKKVQIIGVKSVQIKIIGNICQMGLLSIILNAVAISLTDEV